MSSEGAESVVGKGVRGDEGVEVGEREVVEVGRDEVVEVGRDEVVGVRVDSIPITVVEVEGRGERNYDVHAEIVEEVKQYRSELRTRDSLGHLVENYEISSRVLVRPAGVEERACSAPRDHWMPVYSHYLIAGLRFPLPELLIGLLLDYSIGLTQLVPNAMRGGSRRDKGWYYFTPRVAKKESRILFTAGPSSIKGWKKKFFFVDDTEWGKGDTEGGDVLNIMDLTSAACIEAAELYGPSALSEAEMDQFLNTAGGAPIPKKPRKKSKTSTKQVDEGRAGKEMVPLVSAETEEEVPPLKRKGWEERRALQKKQKVVEEDEGDEVPEEGAYSPTEVSEQPVRGEEHNGGQVVHQQHLPRGGPKQRVTGSSESASWVNGLAQEFRESLMDRALLQRQRDQLQKEKEVLEKKNKDLQESLDEVVPTLKQLEQERSSLSTKFGFEESKRKISESEREVQAQELKLTKEAFLELKGNVQTLEEGRKKVKAEYPEVDITKITFGEQEEGVEEDGESMSADFRPQIKLRWEDDANGRVVFPPQFDFKFVAVEEEGAEVEEDEMEARVEGAEVDENQPVLEVEIHPVPSDDDQPPPPDEQQPTQPPPPAE
ncbi:hypothetical protein SLEP1_g26157 [Rubroshorea leprosula]|uniref:Uncharacterized protein n=1 Tax=Rubroshorea leprosula TaxID=152421 RepID=A0AAV5JVQ7_9ROSI|nr:hypothetical protein SLEP1_g26157 [Rubroshorea leprosula]